jgi:A/G-specific adenine glycosylase
MLQQTRATVVIPYFERWMRLFPDVTSLALAPLEQVIKAWEGLGYYSRARNLHQGAKQILEKWKGEIPSDPKILESIRGIGRYTVGAILSFAFHKKAAAVDGNVTRVLSRYFLIEENVSKSKVKKEIEQKTLGLLDHTKPWVTMEALIELGATVCVQKPRCSSCPLQEGCLGLKENKAESLPIKNEEKEAIHLHRTVVLIESCGMILVKKGETGQVMADLYEFPYFEKKGSRRQIKEWISQEFGLVVELGEALVYVKHSFTRYQAHLYPIRVSVEVPKQVDGYNWILQEKLHELPFSSGHRRILKQL